MSNKNCTLIHRVESGKPLAILVQGVSEKECKRLRDDVYRPTLGGEYEIYRDSLVYTHRGAAFYQLGKGRDCVWAHGDRVRFGTVTEIKADIDMVRDFGCLPPKGKIW